MPVQQGYTTFNGRDMGYYRWGDEGKKYLYKPGMKSQREKAKKKAETQGDAIEASKNTPDNL